MKLFKYFTLLFFVAFTGGPLQAESDLSLQQVTEHHTVAIGGAKALHQVHALRIHLKIKEPSFELNGVYTADRDMHMRIDLFSSGKRVYTEAFDGQKGWEMGENLKASDGSPEGSVALRNGILSPDRFFSLQDLAEKGLKVTLEGRETIGAVNYYILRIDTDGATKDLYINPETWLIERSRETKPLHVDLDPTPQTMETVYSDFKTVGGIIYSFHDVQTNLKTGAVVQEETIDQIEPNPSVDPSYFSKPKE